MNLKNAYELVCQAAEMAVADLQNASKLGSASTLRTALEMVRSDLRDRPPPVTKVPVSPDAKVG